MGAWTHIFTDGNIIARIVFLQAAVAALVVFMLKRFLDRELFVAAIERLSQVSALQASEVPEVVVVAARKFSGDEEFRLRMIIKEKFPQAEIIIGEDRSLRGGLLIRAGTDVLDFTLLTKLRHLFRIADA